jgi:hypothetical protein
MPIIKKIANRASTIDPSLAKIPKTSDSPVSNIAVTTSGNMKPAFAATQEPTAVP